MWSMKDESFWRGPFSAQSEIVDVARSIALSRFREVGGWCSYYEIIMIKAYHIEYMEMNLRSDLQRGSSPKN